jgi:tripartite ATP-independent transporter DctM subunit
MDSASTFALMGTGLLLLFLAGVPIYAAFLICNLAGLFLLVGTSGVGMFVNSIMTTATSSSLLALPLFVLMGEVLYRANAIDTLIESTDRLVGRIRGRHYVLSLIVSTILSTLSGSAMANSAMLSRTVYPTMKARGYDQSMTLGILMGGACLAPIIPPSVLAIIVATIAQVSVKDLFIAGVVPGVGLSLMMIAYVFIRVYFNPALAPNDPDRPAATAGELARALLNLLPFTLVIGSVMGSILMGIATPNESAVVGVLGALVVAALFGRLNWKLVSAAVSSTTRITAMVMAIMLSSQLFSQLLAFSGAGAAISAFVNSLTLTPGLMFFVLIAIPFVICMVLDEIACMLILIPIYYPLLPILGYDPIWFWTIFLITITLGAIVPPVGYVLFVMQGVIGDVKLNMLYRASLPIVAIYVLMMVILWMFPQIVSAWG